MRGFGVGSLSAAILLQLSTAASAQSPATPPVPAPLAAAPAKPLSTCEGLTRDWRAAEIELAENYAEGLADDSAPRATMRAVQDQNALLKAQLTVGLMRDNKCPLPKRAPSSLTYTINALGCRTEKLKGNYKAPACDHSTWTPIGQNEKKVVTE